MRMKAKTKYMLNNFFSLVNQNEGKIKCTLLEWEWS